VTRTPTQRVLSRARQQSLEVLGSWCLSALGVALVEVLRSMQWVCAGCLDEKERRTCNGWLGRRQSAPNYSMPRAEYGLWRLWHQSRSALRSQCETVHVDGRKKTSGRRKRTKRKSTTG